MAGLTFLVLFLILMLLTTGVPALLRRFHVPAVIAMLLVGIVIGPNALDLLGLLSEHLGRGYPVARLHAVIEAMGLLGLVFLMAMAGMEINLRTLASEKLAVTWLSLLTFAVPAAAGYGVYAAFQPDDTIGKWVSASLFASHSVGIVFPVIRELKVTRTRFGVAVLASTVITDLASLVLLAVCIQFKRHAVPGWVAGSISVFDHMDPAVMGNWFTVTFLISVVLYIALCLWLVPRCARFVFSRFHPRDDARLTVFLAAVLLVVMLGELVGVSLIVGAFVAGMSLIRTPEFHAEGRILHAKVQGAGYGLLIPFMFISIGMKTDLSSLLAARENIVLVFTTIVALVGSKVFSGWLAMRLSGFTHAKGLCAGLMTVPQLSATLAAATVAIQLEMIPPVFFNAIVCLSIVTTLPTPSLVKWIIRRQAIKFDTAQDALNLDPEDDKSDEQSLVV